MLYICNVSSKHTSFLFLCLYPFTNLIFLSKNTLITVIIAMDQCYRAKLYNFDFNNIIYSIKDINIQGYKWIYDNLKTGDIVYAQFNNQYFIVGCNEDRKYLIEMVYENKYGHYVRIPKDFCLIVNFPVDYWDDIHNIYEWSINTKKIRRYTKEFTLSNVCINKKQRLSIKQRRIIFMYFTTITFELFKKQYKISKIIGPIHSIKTTQFNVEKQKMLDFFNDNNDVNIGRRIRNKKFTSFEIIPDFG